MKTIFFITILLFALVSCSQRLPEPEEDEYIPFRTGFTRSLPVEITQPEIKARESEEEPEQQTTRLLIDKNHVKITSNLSDVVFNARFLEIPTYEGSGQTVHPHVLFFKEKFMGFHYIMVITPYPYANNAHENPSILGSQDGVIWEVPEGVTNPVVGFPFDVNYGGYYSDPFILLSGDTLELWFRHTLARNEKWQAIRRNSHNRIYRVVSNDLVNWSELDIALDCPENIDHFMSASIIKDGSMYRLWYTNFSSQLFYIESKDLINWSERIWVQADLGGLGIWHHEIRFTGERYEALLTSADWGNNPEFRLFHAVSYDGLDFGTGREISIRCISPALSELTVHKCSFVKIDRVYQMYITVFCNRNVWRLFYFEIAEENFYRLFRS